MLGSTFYKKDEVKLYHYGTKYHSGRYPYGSGENPYQHDPGGFLKEVKSMRSQGMSDAEIAKGMGMNSTQLRARYNIAREWKRAHDIDMTLKLDAKGLSHTAIAERLGVTEGTVRNYLKGITQERNNITKNVADTLKKNVDKHGYIDIGSGVANGLGVNQNRLKTAVAMLEDEGYRTTQIQVEQVGTGYKTYVKVLCKPTDKSDSELYREVAGNKEKIKLCDEISSDNGRSFEPTFLGTPVNVDSKRIKVRYAEEGGLEKDGVIEIRRGCEDLALGNSTYAQVRIAVDGTHYLKGMAVYSDNMPKGTDIIFNTNKHIGTPMCGEDKNNTVLKKLDPDPITKNPFGAEVRQFEYVDSHGKKQQSPINLVNEEGDWSNWSRNLASQMLSKQPVPLASKQLNLAYVDKQAEFEEIKSLTNPVIRKKLLMAFADNCDSAAVHLKAAALPRQATHVILPVPSLKPNEIYAPNYNDGEQVALIRYPHGGIFEIPILKVNNSNQEAKKVMGANAKDAVGINAKVATQLSGADFDGDTVLVIPTKNAKINSKPYFKELENFDPHEQYKGYDGLPKMKNQTKQNEMGKATNLIMDMTLKGASDDEIIRAVKHSMVVIDAQKHNLDYKRSEAENGIKELKAIYQGGSNNGASTIITRAKSRDYVPQRTLRFKVNEKGEKVYDLVDDKDRFYTKTRVLKDGTVKKEVVERQTRVTKMEKAKDAFDLVSDKKNPLPMETVYATHANKMKALANEARKEWASTPNLVKEPSAAKVYAEEVKSLNSKLNTALKHAPSERQAQIIANHMIDMKKASNPDMEEEDLKKYKGKALAVARQRMGGGKELITITPKEWEAIQAGAIAHSKLEAIIDNADLDEVKKLATPRQSNGLPDWKITKIKAMKSTGHYTNAEIAKELGISTTAVSNAIKS